MKFYITFDELAPNTITVRARAVSEDGSMKGDSIKDLKPGDTLGPLTYEQLRQRGPGVIEIGEERGIRK